MTKSLKNAVLGTLVSLAAVAYGNTIWYPDRTQNMHDMGKGNEPLKNLSYWKDEGGNSGSGAPTASDDLIFDKAAAPRLRFNGGTVGKFTGNSLQIGTDTQSTTAVYDGSGFSCDNEGLKLKYGSWFFNSGNSMSIQCDVAILAEDASKPFVMHYGQEQYSNCVGSVTKKLKGSSDAQLLLGPWPVKYGNNTPSCAPNTTFWFYDISSYSGTITVTSRFANVVAADGNHGYGTRLRLNAGTSDAKLRIMRGGSLALQNFGDTATVKELSLACGSRLWFNQGDKATGGSLWCVRATDALTVEQGADKVEIYLTAHICGIDCRVPILAGPAGSTFTTNDFKIVTPPFTLFCHPDIHLEVGQDEETGDRTLYVVTHHHYHPIWNRLVG